jgi:hypothetical protein
LAACVQVSVPVGVQGRAQRAVTVCPGNADRYEKELALGCEVQKRHILKWILLLLVGPAVGVGGVVLYEHDIARDTGGLLAGIGWITAAIVTAWFVIKVFRSLPVRYSVWAMLGAIPVAIVSALMHGLVVWLTGEDEPFFFILAIFGSPVLLLGGFIGWVTRRGRSSPTLSPPSTSG